MGNGMSAELLLQLWLVFEGFSLWKIIRMPDRVGIVPTDFSEACESILQGAGTATEKVRRANEFKKALKWYKIWKPIVDFFEKAYAGIILSALFVFLSLLIDIKHPVVKCLLTWGLGMYMFLKMVIYRWAKESFISYHKQLSEIVPVPLTKQEPSFKLKNLDS